MSRITSSLEYIFSANHKVHANQPRISGLCVNNNPTKAAVYRPALPAIGGYSGKTIRTYNLPS